MNAKESDGATALYVAIANDKDDVVKALIDKGADVNIADNTGRTPLMVAAEKGLLAITQALLSGVVVCVFVFARDVSVVIGLMKSRRKCAFHNRLKVGY